MERLFPGLMVLLVLAGSVTSPAALAAAGIGVNVLLDQPATEIELRELGRYGRVTGRLDRLDAVFMSAAPGNLAKIAALPFVKAANRDARRWVGPFGPVLAGDFLGGRNTWNLDAVNVTDFDNSRVVGLDGSGVYVAVLDTGLLKAWKAYLPEARIVEELAMAYTGGGSVGVRVWEVDSHKWQTDTDSHGTHVTSVILGYYMDPWGEAVTGVAPKARVIPVKVLNNHGMGWSSVIAYGITYVADLKCSADALLAEHPIVINMSLGGPQLDAVEQAAIDYAVACGVIVVASAGNEGVEGMGYPGAYEPVISVAASGWIEEWQPLSNGEVDRSWWWSRDVADPINPGDVYITDFSSRALAGQDLDVTAPGSWVVGPWQEDLGELTYYFVGGTSQASPHVAGLVALMAQAEPTLTAPQAESLLETYAIPLAPGCRQVLSIDGIEEEMCWSDDATGAGLIDAPAVLAGM